MKILMPKYFLTLIGILLLNISYAQEDKALVVCSASIFKDMTKMIAGDLVNIETIVPIGGDPHIYEPTPKDAKLVAKADLILINGLTFEGWINELVENSGTEARSVLITEGIKALTSTTYKNSSDPHAWMTAVNGIQYLNNIANALIELDPANEATYSENLEKSNKQLIDLDHKIKEQINTIPAGKRILITSHDAFQYFGKHYGIQLEALMGISTDSEAQTSDIKRVIEIIRESHVPAIFIESTINPKIIKQIATDNNVAIGGELYADSLGEEGGEAGTYIDMLMHNMTIIVNALAKEEYSETKIDNETKIPSWILYALLGVILLFGMIFMIMKINR